MDMNAEMTANDYREIRDHATRLRIAAHIAASGDELEARTARRRVRHHIAVLALAVTRTEAVL